MALPIAVLVSGSGSNLQSIIDHIERGVLDVQIKLVLSNNAQAYGLQRAKKHGLTTQVLEHANFASREEFDQEMINIIRGSGAEVVVLAGFMRILSSVFINAFHERILNIHPALLPSFPGLHGQKQQLDYGVCIAGCTVHFVDEKMDHGPIIIQATVPVLSDDDEDSLGKRILAMEHRIYPQALQWLAQDRLNINGRKVVLQGDLQYQSCEGFLVSPPLEPWF